MKGKDQLPPSILVGARSDRGESALSRQDLEQFCQRNNISGGYVSTSAKTGEGLDRLLTILKEQIPWDGMTTTVTTRTFKRVKEYVLSLKEVLALHGESESQHVLVNSTELHMQLRATDENWSFSDAEMMTAIGHLETHGFVSVLKSSSGDQFILLTPDLLISLAASIVLLADKNQRELGAINEAELLHGRYRFSELAQMEDREKHILIESAILRFLEHNVCFRKVILEDSFLIFPGLIKQKRPLDNDHIVSEDVSYVVRGRIENLYASLVVLLGYTPSFTRIHQWQKQAQYEMGAGEICGFRLVEEFEGEIELVLYFSIGMPSHGRESFQELFELFLYQHDVEVTRFPSVMCAERHKLERSIIISRVRAGRDFVFCPECGGKVELSELHSSGIGIGVSNWLRREEAEARLRSTYEAHLASIKGYRRDWATPRCYLSCVSENELYAEKLIQDLQEAGVYIIGDAMLVQPDDYIVMLDTRAYKREWNQPSQAFESDIQIIKARLGNKRYRLIAVRPEDNAADASSHDLYDCIPGDFYDATHYPVSFFNLVLELYAIPLTHPGFVPLRETIHEQWERLSKEFNDDSRELNKQIINTVDEKRGGALVNEQYIDFDLQIAPNGHAVVRSVEGEASAKISTETPKDILLSRKLIEMRQTDETLIKQFGITLYDWLLPAPLDKHLHATEAVARMRDVNLRLRLRIEAEEIASLPLEFMYRETSGYFVAINPSTVLSRYLNVAMPSRYVRCREDPLHMLAIIADPTDQARLHPDEWETIIKEALAGPLDSGQMTLQTVKRATRKEIRNALRHKEPNIIQFVGHGIYQDGKGYLALVDEDTYSTWLVDDETFANLYLGYDDHLGLVNLATCESAKSDNPQGFLGIAPKLVQRGVPAVLSMQYQVYVKTAKIFLEDFYAAVSIRKPIDWATQSARNAVSQEQGLDNREFATPVLYMRANHGDIF